MTEEELEQLMNNIYDVQAEEFGDDFDEELSMAWEHTQTSRGNK